MPEATNQSDNSGKNEAAKTPPVGTPRPRKGPPVFPPGSVIKELLTRTPEKISEEFLKNYKVL
jgi:hypothetical protein